MTTQNHNLMGNLTARRLDRIRNDLSLIRANAAEHDWVPEDDKLTLNNAQDNVIEALEIYHELLEIIMQKHYDIHDGLRDPE